MPISTLISLIPETDVILRPTMGHHAHAAFLAILRKKATQRSQKCSTHNRRKNRLPSRHSSLRQKRAIISFTSRQAPSANSDSRFLRIRFLQPSGALF